MSHIPWMRFPGMRRAQRSRTTLLTIEVLIAALLLMLIQLLPISAFTPSALADHVPTSALTKATFTLDGVTVNIATPLLPGPFVTSQPGDATQVATSQTAAQHAHPYSALSITAVPFGTKPTTENVPVAQTAGAQAYRASLHQYRANADENPQPGPTATLFGQQITGEASLKQGNVTAAYSSTVIVEWVVEAGKRLWIIRMTQEEPLGTVNLTPASPFLISLHALALASSTLNRSTTVKVQSAAANVVHPLVTTFPSPGWWSSTCEDKAGTSPAGSYAMASWQGLTACGPIGTAANSTFGGLSVDPDASEWQCVELVQRYLLVAGYTKDTYAGDGAQQVSNYPNTKLTQFPSTARYNTSPLSQLSVQGEPFQAGDVISYADMSSTSTPIWGDSGHTAVVTSVNWTNQSAGNGSFTILQENSGTSSAPLPAETFTISSWLLEDSVWPGGDQRIVDWLDPGTNGGAGSGINNQDAFAVGQNGHLEDYHWTLGSNWVASDLGTPTGTILTGTPSSNTFTSGTTQYQHVLVVGNNGHLYEYWQQVGHSWSSNDLNAKAAPPAGTTFVGSPSSFSYTASGPTYHSVFILGSDSHLYDYAWVSSNSSAWTLTDLNSQVTLPSGVTWLGVPSANAFISGGNQYQHVIMLGSDGHLYEVWQFIGENWNLNDLYADASPGTGVTFVGSPDLFSYTNNGQTFHSIFLLGSDNNLYNYVWSGSQNTWAWTDLTQQRLLPSGVTPTGTPSGDAFVSGGTQYVHVEIVGSDGNLYEYWQTAGQLQGTWNGLNNLNTLASSTVVVTGSPWSQSYVAQGSTAETHSVYVVTSNNHLQEFNWVAGTANGGNGTWQVIDHGLPPNTTLSGSSPNATAYTN